MQTKWGILDRTIPLSVKQTGKVICAIAWLHNFVINEWLDIVSEAPTKLVYWPSQPENANGDLIDDEGNVITFPREAGFRGWSKMRKFMAYRVQRRGLECPLQNVCKVGV